MALVMDAVFWGWRFSFRAFVSGDWFTVLNMATPFSPRIARFLIMGGEWRKSPSARGGGGSNRKFRQAVSACHDFCLNREVLSYRVGILYSFFMVLSSFCIKNSAEDGAEWHHAQR